MLTLISQGPLVCLVAQSCLTLRPHGLQPARLLCPWDSPGKNTGVGSRSLLQDIFPNHGSNPGLPHCRWILYGLSHRGSTEVSFCDIAGLRVLIVKRKVKVAQSCAPLYDPTDCVVLGNTEASFCIWQFSSNIWSKRGLAVWSKSSCGPVSIPWPKLFIYFSTFANETFNLMCMHTL